MDIRHVATSTILDPYAGPITAMVFHIASNDALRSFETIKHMGILSQPNVEIAPAIQFIRVFYLNSCFSQGDVLTTLNLPTSPIQEIVDETLAVSFYGLHEGGKYLYNDETYLVTEQVGEYLYNVQKEKKENLNDSK